MWLPDGTFLPQPEVARQLWPTATVFLADAAQSAAQVAVLTYAQTQVTTHARLSRQLAAAPIGRPNPGRPFLLNRPEPERRTAEPLPATLHPFQTTLRQPPFSGGRVGHHF
ncbi:hypothetical protein IC235_12115 [Hymenobacter sp. BT664]|uniref:Uncharacterized protein n=1 Tax=Hymenobacter montanus TaxID=2771359 RepID=A0A927BEI1_9BACT|nr:hypothetical protein [Hymenobacter montanus]MBD2768633.1 hypothetical protein [Hymenobacter montanus]